MSRFVSSGLATDMSPMAGPSTSTSISTSPSPPFSASTFRTLFPGFLSTEEPDEMNHQRVPSPVIGTSRSSPIDSPSPTTLPYLRGSPATSPPPSRSSPARTRLGSLDPDEAGSTKSGIGAPRRTGSGGGDGGSGGGPSSARLASAPNSAGGRLTPKRRPTPLDLKGKGVGLDEEFAAQRKHEGLRSGISIVSSDDSSTLSDDMQDLSLLRNTMRQNLLDRPIDSPGGFDSDRGSSGFQTPDPSQTLFPTRRPPTQTHTPTPAPLLSEQDTIPVSEAVRRLHASPQCLVVDTRPLGSFLDSHLPRSANLSIPTLIFKRFRKAIGAKPTWDSLGGFVSTQAGKEVWAGLDLDRDIDVIVVGTRASDEMPKVLREVMAGLVDKGSVTVLRGGWAAVVESDEASEELVSGERSVPSHITNAPKSTSTTTASLPPPRSAPPSDIPRTLPSPPPIPPSDPAQRVTHHPSMPSLRPDGPTRRNLPALSVQTGASPSRRPPKLSLNLDKPLRSATLGSFPTGLPPRPGSPGMLSINTGEARQNPPGLSVSVTAPQSPRFGSFQTLCHEQSKLPPSAKSFGDLTLSVRDQADGHGEVIGNGYGNGNATAGPSRSPRTPWSAVPTARPDGGLRGGHELDWLETDIPPTPGGLATARAGMAPFVVSTILPNFLYLGPEIASDEDVDTLKRLGVKRILNVAIECNDDEGLRLRERFERYLRVPMRDIVEESNVGKGMRDACEFLDDARLHSAPTYVHCKAGKSRSVTVVLAYLIHANAWTLKTSYAYVAERRRGISPNIGFVAELMQFEEAELGLKQSGGVHGEGSGSGRKAPREGQDDERNGDDRKRVNPRYMRESLPPTWAASLDSKPPRPLPIGGTEGDDQAESGADGQSEQERRPLGNEREVRKNGQWVHHRRAPVDRTTLQPGRRVSKAGLESLRSLETVSSVGSPRPSPQPSPGLGDHPPGAATPGVEGRLGWV